MDTERGRRSQDLPGGDPYARNLAELGGLEEEPDDGLPLAGVTGKKIRTVRVGDGLWDAAAEAAASQGVFMADVIRGLLVDYVRREKRRGTVGRRH